MAEFLYCLERRFDRILLLAVRWASGKTLGQSVRVGRPWRQASTRAPITARVGARGLALAHAIPACRAASYVRPRNRTAGLSAPPNPCAGTEALPVDVDVKGGADGVSLATWRFAIETGASSRMLCKQGQLAGGNNRSGPPQVDVHLGDVRSHVASEPLIEGVLDRHGMRSKGAGHLVSAVSCVLPHGKPPQGRTAKCIE